jgi:hypothetical protein
MQNLSVYAQKEDYQWLFGGDGCINFLRYRTTHFDFNSIPINMTDMGVDVEFLHSVSTLCDSMGKLKIIANGNILYNGDYEKIEGGEQFIENEDGAWVLPQCDILLEYPGHPEQYAYITGDDFYLYPHTQYENLNFSVVDMSLNNGAGKVILKEQHIIEDTLSLGVWTACRHANGRDWWIIASHFRDDLYYTLLLDPRGLSLHHTQSIGKSEDGLGEAVFSPDGNWYARYGVPGIIGQEDRTVIDVYHFDRCSGLLSGYQNKEYEILQGRPGGVAFSPDSRFLYAANWDKVLQFDMQSPNIFASEKTVAVYDGFLDERNLPTRFYHMLLGPDGRIYFSVSNYNSRYLHVIDQPNLVDTACNVLQHSIYLPNYNNWTIPSIPYHRLYAQSGSLCDTLTVAVNDIGKRLLKTSIYPNPAIYSATLILPIGGLPLDGTLIFYDAMGREIKKLNVPAHQEQINLILPDLPMGICLYELEIKHHVISHGKIVIGN